MKRAWSLLGNSQRLDGGAMFGNVPRALWQRWITPDEHHRIPLACRCLLIEEEGGRRVLFEAGIGAFFEPKLRDRFGVQESHHVLLDSLASIGLKPEDIDVVVLSHLHFDHAGGLLTPYHPERPSELVFPRAHYVVGEQAWQRAATPHPLDRASFIPQLLPLLQATGRVERITAQQSTLLGEGYSFHRSNGHTPGLLVAEIASDDGPVVFAADLIPGVPWVHLPITMGYDRYPELLIDEKTELLSGLVQRNGRLFFTHDSNVAMARVCRDARDRYATVEPQAALHGMSL